MTLSSRFHRQYFLVLPQTKTPGQLDIGPKNSFFRRNISQKCY